MSDPVRPIQPELLAAKIEKIANFEFPELLDQFGQEPRLTRALWFLQWVSQPVNYPGGLSRFACDFIASQADHVGTAQMAKATVKAGRYALSDAIAILRELSSDARRSLFGGFCAMVEEEYAIRRVTWETWNDDPGLPLPKPRSQSSEECSAVLLKRLTPKSAKEICIETARQELAAYLKRVCEVPRVALRKLEGISPSVRQFLQSGPDEAPWYFVNVADALLAFMDARAKQLRLSLADTEVTHLVYRWIVKSRNMKRGIMIIGNSRFGKSEAAKLHAKMYPCSCRWVNTPEFNSVSDLLLEIAKSVGLEVGPTNAGRELRERIDYVLRFSGLQIIFDESQRLLPAVYSKNTAPARLNWVRRSFMEPGREIAAVFICTPQSYLPAKLAFVKKTGFAMEQFDERILKTVRVPEKLSEADLLAVARIHFPQLADEYLHFVVNKALATERNFVSDIEKIATLAKDNAREQDRKQPTLADIKAAIADVLPFALAPIDDRPSKPRQKQPVQRPCKRPAAPLQPSRIDSENLPQFSRETRPVMLTT